MLGQLGGEVAPTLGLSALQGQLTQQQLAQVPQQVALENQFTSTIAGYTMAKLGISSQQNTLAEQTLFVKGLMQQGQNTLEQQQYGLTTQQQALQEQQYGLTQQQQTIERQQFANTLRGFTIEKQEYGLTTQQQTLERQQYTLTRQQETIGQKAFTLTQTKYGTERLAQAQTYKNKIQAEQGAVAVSGAEGTVGAQRAYATINLQNQLKLTTINRSQQLATMANQQTILGNKSAALGQQSTLLTQEKVGLGQQTTLLQQQNKILGQESTTLGYQKTALGQQSTLLGYEKTALGQQSTLLGQKYSTEEIQNQYQNLQLLAQSNGLSQQEVLTRLNYSIANNQLQGVSSSATLLNKLAGIYSGGETTLGTGLALGGFGGGLNLYAGAASGL